MENLPRIQREKDIRALPDLGFGKPVAVIGAAPIARETFEILSELKATTVCCDKALPKILEHYRPAFVTALNTQKTKDVELEKWFEDSEGMGLIVPVTVHPDTVKLWKGEVYWMNPTNVDDDLVVRFEQETAIPRWARGLNVGEFSLNMAAFMRPAEITMFGMWYAWTKREDVFDETDDVNNYDVVELVEHGETWYSNLTWLQGRASLMTFCKQYHTQGIDIFNASEGGILYHPEFCKRIRPLDFRDRWLDIGSDVKDKKMESQPVPIRSTTEFEYGGD